MILYEPDETMVDGERKPIFIDDEVQDMVQMILRKVWNSRPDYDPPSWGELFNYTQSHQGVLKCGATMEQVICFILGKPFSQTSIDEITPIKIKDILITFIKYHKDIPLFILCKKCHREYDKEN